MTVRVNIKLVCQARGYDVDPLPKGAGWAVLTPLGDRIGTTHTEEHGWALAAQNFGVTYEPDLPRITSCDDWLDLGEDVEALVFGRIDRVGEDVITLSMCDWSLIAVHCEMTPLLRRHEGEHVELAVVHKDGILTATMAHAVAIKRTRTGA